MVVGDDAVCVSRRGSNTARSSPNPASDPLIIRNLDATPATARVVKTIWLVQRKLENARAPTPSFRPTRFVPPH
jgi:hypothetical protein